MLRILMSASVAVHVGLAVCIPLCCKPACDLAQAFTSQTFCNWVIFTAAGMRSCSSLRILHETVTLGSSGGQAFHCQDSFASA